MKYVSIWLGLAVLLLAAGPAMAQSKGDPAAGKDKAYQCMGCHGVKDYTNAYPTYNVPKVAGQRPQYIEKALKEYRSGARKHPTMHAQASSLSDQDIRDIAAFFASEGPQ